MGDENPMSWGNVTIIKKDGKDGGIMNIYSRTVTVGKAGGSDIQVALDQIAEEHCKIIVEDETPDSDVFLVDNAPASAPPTILNDYCLRDLNLTQIQLVSNDIITLHTRHLRFNSTRSPELEEKIAAKRNDMLQKLSESQNEILVEEEEEEKDEKKKPTKKSIEKKEAEQNKQDEKNSEKAEKQSEEPNNNKRKRDEEVPKDMLDALIEMAILKIEEPTKETVVDFIREVLDLSEDTENLDINHQKVETTLKRYLV